MYLSQKFSNMEAIARPSSKRSTRKIPDALIYEIMDGKPIYRKGYKSVLNKSKKLEDIMGSSTLQAEVVFYLLRQLMLFYDEQHFTIHTNEAGLHIGKGDNLAGDIFVYESAVMTAENINKKYSSVPPMLAFEIDINADPEALTELGYVSRKIEKLLDFGVQKVFWISTDAQMVIVAVAGGEWRSVSWKNDLEIVPGLVVNIAGHLKKRGVEV